MDSLSVDHLLGIKYLNKNDIELILRTAETFSEVLSRPIKKVPSLNGTTIANLFFENSTRTRTSFELAEKRLSADVVNFSASVSSVSKGETLIDTVNNILSMKVDMVVMRHPDPGACVFLSKNVPAQIVNAGDGTHEHPTQALLDSYSLRRRFGSVKGLKVVIVGDITHSRVAISNIYALQMQGAEVMVCGPATLIPRYIESMGVRVETNLRKAVEQFNEVCRIMTEINAMREAENPVITGYEFHVITLATYVAPKYLLIDKLEELEDLDEASFQAQAGDAVLLWERQG